MVFLMAGYLELQNLVGNMTLNNQLANMLSIIRNGQRALLSKVAVPQSNLSLPILKLLYKEGFISGFSLQQEGNFYIYEVTLKYVQGQPAIQELDCISKPGKQKYITVKEIKQKFKKSGLMIISTTKGVVTQRSAIENNLGGCLLCKVN